MCSALWKSLCGGGYRRVLGSRTGLYGELRCCRKMEGELRSCGKMPEMGDEFIECTPMEERGLWRREGVPWFEPGRLKGGCGGGGPVGGRLICGCGVQPGVTG